MHPIIKSAIYTFLGFALIVALAYMNRNRIDRYNQKLECHYCHPVHK